MAGQAVSWLSTLFVIRALSPADYGLMGMAMVIIGLAAMIRELGFGSALIQASELPDGLLPRVFTFLLGINGGLYLGMIAIAPLVASFFEEQSLVPIINVLAFQFPIMAFEVIPQAMLAREMRFKERSLIVLAGNLVNSAVTLALALTGFGVWALIFGQLAGSLARVIGCSLAQPIYYGLSLHLKGIGHIVSYGTAFTTSRFLNFLTSKLPHAIVGRALGTETLGFYSVAGEIATMPFQKLMGVLNPISLAAFSRIKDDNHAIANNYLYSISVTAVVAFPIFVGLSATANHAVPVILGDKWTPVIFPLALVCLGSPLRMLYELSVPMLFAIGHARTALRNQIVRLIVAPTATLAGTPWGLDGVVTAALLSHLLVFIYTQSAVVAVLTTNARGFYGAFATPLLTSLVMGGAVYGVGFDLSSRSDSTWLVFVLQIFTGIIVYGILTYIFNRTALVRTISILRQ